MLDSATTSVRVPFPVRRVRVGSTHVHELASVANAPVRNSNRRVGRH
jgi:hypothetical protein